MFKENVNLNFQAPGLQRVLAQTDLLSKKLDTVSKQKLGIDTTQAMSNLKILDAAVKSLSNIKINVKLDISQVFSAGPDGQAILDLMKLQKTGIDIKVSTSGFDQLNKEIATSVANMEKLSQAASKVGKANRNSVQSFLEPTTTRMTKQEASRILTQRARTEQRSRLEGNLRDLAGDIQTYSTPERNAIDKIARNKAMKAIEKQRKELTSETLALQDIINDSKRSIQEVQKLIVKESKIKPTNAAQQILKDNTLSNLRTQLGVQQDRLLKAEGQQQQLSVIDDYLISRKKALKTPTSTLKPLTDYYAKLKSDIEGLDKAQEELLKSVSLANGRQAKTAAENTRSNIRKSIRDTANTAMQSGDTQIAGLLRDPRIRAALIEGKLNLSDVEEAGASKGRSESQKAAEEQQNFLRKQRKQEESERFGKFNPSRLKDPNVATQIGFGLLFGGPVTAAGAVVGGAFGGPVGAIIGSTLTQALQKTLFAPIDGLKGFVEESKDLGLALQRSILGITAVRQANIDLTTEGGQPLPLNKALGLQSKEALRIQTAARSKLLPLGIAGSTEATFVQGIVSALSQRGLTGSASQVARIAELLGGAIQTQRPQLLDNTTLLLRDIQDVVGGGPLAQRTVLSQLIKPAFGAGLQQAKTIEDVVKSLEALSAFPEAAKNLDNPITLLNKLAGAFDNLKTQTGSKFIEALAPALKSLFDVISSEEVVKAGESLGATFGKVSAVMLSLQGSAVKFGAALTNNVAKPLVDLIPTLAGVAAAVAAIEGVALLSGKGSIVGKGLAGGAGALFGGAKSQLIQAGILKEIFASDDISIDPKLKFGGVKSIGEAIKNFFLKDATGGLAGGVAGGVARGSLITSVGALAILGGRAAFDATVDAKDEENQRLQDKALESIQKVNVQLKDESKFRSAISPFGLTEDFEKFTSERAIPSKESITRGLVKVGKDFTSASKLTAAKAEFLAKVLGENIDATLSERSKGRFDTNTPTGRLEEALANIAERFPAGRLEALDTAIRLNQEELDKIANKSPEDIKKEKALAQTLIGDALANIETIKNEQEELATRKRKELVLGEGSGIVDPVLKKQREEGINQKFFREESVLNSQFKEAQDRLNSARETFKNTASSADEALKRQQDRLQKAKDDKGVANIQGLRDLLSQIAPRKDELGNVLSGISDGTAAGKEARTSAVFAALTADLSDINASIDRTLVQLRNGEPGITEGTLRGLQQQKAAKEQEIFITNLQKINDAMSKLDETLRGQDLTSVSGKNNAANIQVRKFQTELAGLIKERQKIERTGTTEEDTRKANELRIKEQEAVVNINKATEASAKTIAEGILDRLRGLDTGIISGQETAAKIQIEANNSLIRSTLESIADLRQKIARGESPQANTQAFANESQNLSQYLAKQQQLERELVNVANARKDAERQLIDTHLQLRKVMDTEGQQRRLLNISLKESQNALTEFRNQRSLREFGAQSGILGLVQNYKQLTGVLPSNVPGEVLAAANDPTLAKQLAANLLQEQISAATRAAEGQPDKDLDEEEKLKASIVANTSALDDFQKTIDRTKQAFEDLIAKLQPLLTSMSDFNGPVVQVPTPTIGPEPITPFPGFTGRDDGAFGVGKEAGYLFGGPLGGIPDLPPDIASVPGAEKVFSKLKDVVPNLGKTSAKEEKDIEAGLVGLTEGPKALFKDILADNKGLKIYFGRNALAFGDKKDKGALGETYTGGGKSSVVRLYLRPDSDSEVLKDTAQHEVFGHLADSALAGKLKYGAASDKEFYAIKDFKKAFDSGKLVGNLTEFPEYKAAYAKDRAALAKKRGNQYVTDDYASSSASDNFAEIMSALIGGSSDPATKEDVGNYPTVTSFIKSSIFKAYGKDIFAPGEAKTSLSDIPIFAAGSLEKPNPVVGDIIKVLSGKPSASAGVPTIEDIRKGFPGFVMNKLGVESGELLNSYDFTMPGASIGTQGGVMLGEQGDYSVTRLLDDTNRASSLFGDLESGEFAIDGSVYSPNKKTPDLPNLVKGGLLSNPAKGRLANIIPPDPADAPFGGATPNFNRSDVLKNLNVPKPETKDAGNVKDAIDNMQGNVASKLDTLIKLTQESKAATEDPNSLRSIIASAAREALQSEFQ